MNQKDYIRLSLELHLFFDRIMKEHSIFLEASFLDKDNDLKRIASEFQETFSNILNNVISIADGNISESLLLSNEFVTNNTITAERLTSDLSGISIDNNITKKELNLKSGNIIASEQLINEISSINRKTLPAIENLIYF